MPATVIVSAGMGKQGREFARDLRFAGGRITGAGSHVAHPRGDRVVEAGGRGWNGEQRVGAPNGLRLEFSH